mmetsp:Transcript_90407/g.260480  ORF Transcript_90407/g.260480 Transcript_90407/m.260480 type:complete len:317 (-) Transcript_90407:245-1195(-)
MCSEGQQASPQVGRPPAPMPGVATPPFAANAPGADGRPLAPPRGPAPIPDRRHLLRPAGKPARKVSLSSTDDAKAAEGRDVSPRGAATFEGEGWAARDPSVPGATHFRHDPILHEVEVFVHGGGDGGPPDVAPRRCAARCSHTQALRRAGDPRGITVAKVPAAGRRKGLAEFEDLTRRGQRNPMHEARMQSGDHPFNRQRGLCGDHIERAAAYPGKPHPFHTPASCPGVLSGLDPATTALMAAAAASRGGPQVLPPRVARPSSRPASARVRRPPSSLRRSAQPPPQRIAANPTNGRGGVAGIAVGGEPSAILRAAS